MSKETFQVLSAIDYFSKENKKTTWQKIGIAFRTKDGNGMHVLLNALPINGRLLIKKNENKISNQG